MRLLFCCEFYFPSVGGVQEVMRQIAERMVRRGHDVTVATTRLANRDFVEHNGVKIAEFGVAGNLVRGMEGEVERYRAFVESFACDAILIKAAQQWTFDALWPVLDAIEARKVFIPCGFSGLFEPSYVAYFEELPAILRKFDHLIFYAERYRDVDFARKHGLDQFSILPNGASEIEFGVAEDPTFRQRHAIPEDSAVLLTVGSITGVKGHRELLEAFVRLKTKRRHVTFIMNGNEPPKPVVSLQSSQPVFPLQPSPQETHELSNPPDSVPPGVLTRAKLVLQNEGVEGICDRFSRRWHHYTDPWSRRVRGIWRILTQSGYVLRTEGWLGVRVRLMHRIGPRLVRSGLLERMPASIRAMANPMAFWMAEARRDPDNKLLIVDDFPRDELVQAYKAADLFVFASNIEYSPLVLFEAVAAGTPFLSVPVGNAEEIAKWTGAGIICPAPKDERGYTRVSPEVLANAISEAVEKPEWLAELGARGHEAWEGRFTWDAITARYEEILLGKRQTLVEELPCVPA